jgi:hypothetical protein
LHEARIKAQAKAENNGLERRSGGTLLLYPAIDAD